MATPQIPFISVPFKKTDDIDWIRPLSRHIASSYQDDPSKYSEATGAFNRLRQDIRGAGKDDTGRDLLYRYFGQLELLDLRFPVDEKNVKVSFCWYDAFSNRSISQFSLAFEKASILFNEAATLSAIAASQNRAEKEGLNKAFRYFQASAGMFQYINDNFLHAPSEDLSRETVSMLSELMLVQAQECFLESSIRDNAKNNLVAKLASHAVWAYGNLVDSLGDALSRGVGTDKTWVVVCRIKQKYYSAVAQERKAAACEAEGKYGECVSRCSAAEAAIDEASVLAKSLTSLLASSNNANGTMPMDSATAFETLCENQNSKCAKKLKDTTRDNDMIYHDQVPQESILVPINRLKSAQAIHIADLYGPDEMRKVIGPDLFSALVPVSVHMSASVYSEEKRKLVCVEEDKCDIAKVELNICLDYMKLPGSLAKFKQQQSSSLDHYADPPSEVKDCANRITVEEHARPVTKLIEESTFLLKKARQSIDEAELSLNTEMRECEQKRVQYGDQWQQEPSGSRTVVFRKDIANHRESLASASPEDNQLLAKYDTFRRNIDILKHGGQGHELNKAYAECVSVLAASENSKKEYASVSLLDVDSGTDDSKNQDGTLDEKVQKVENIIEKLRKIQTDRENTLRNLGDETRKDDISQLLILNKKANVDQQIFASELEKFRPHQQRITATIKQQGLEIQNLTAAFKILMDTHEAGKLQSQHDKAQKLVRNLTDDLKEASAAYFEIKKGLNDRLQFYSGVQDTVQSLQRNVQQFIFQRTTERNRLMEDIERNKSDIQQKSLLGKLDSYASAPSANTSFASTPSAPPNMDHLSNQVRQMSFGNLPPPPPPKIQHFPHEHRQQAPSPSSYQGQPVPASSQYNGNNMPPPQNVSPQQHYYGANTQFQYPQQQPQHRQQPPSTLPQQQQQQQQQQHQASPQQFQQFQAPSQQFQAPTQQFQAPPQQQQQQQHQASPQQFQQFQAPPQQFQVPPQQFQAYSQQYQTPSPQYQGSLPLHSQPQQPPPPQQQFSQYPMYQQQQQPQQPQQPQYQTPPPFPQQPQQQQQQQQQQQPPRPQQQSPYYPIPGNLMD